jgi:hypothetical protein
VVLDAFCTRYDRQAGACFYISRNGTNCFTFYQQVPGKNLRDIPTDNWDARGWNRDHPSTCPKKPEVEI